MIGAIIFTAISCLSIGAAIGWYAKALLVAVEKDTNDGE